MSKRMIGLALLIAAMCTGMTVQAGNARAARKQVESSLLVQGTITVAADGSVLAHTLDAKAPLGEALSKFLHGSIEKWRFEPVVVDGKVISVKVPMSLRLVAKPAEDGKSSISIASSHFGNREEVPSTDVLRSSELTPPQYPRTALRMGGKGTVYMIVQVGRSGTVINADAEQVNLGVVGTDGEMALLRKQFADAAVHVAKRWIFIPPTTGSSVADENWLARVPVEFVIGEPSDQRTKGQWKSYVPGPRNTNMPWAVEELQTAGSPDAVSEGGVYPLQQGVKLLTPPAT